MFEEKTYDDLSALDAMRRGVDYRLEISVREFKILVRPLTMKETISVMSKVNEKLLKSPESARTKLYESKLLACETLKLATTDDVDSTRLSSLTDEIMDRMTPEELQYLHKQYVAALDRVNPAMEALPKERLDELVDAIKKKEILPTDLSFLEAANVCRYLIFRD